MRNVCFPRKQSLNLQLFDVFKWIQWGETVLNDRGPSERPPAGGGSLPGSLPRPPSPACGAALARGSPGGAVRHHCSYFTLVGRPRGRPWRMLWSYVDLDKTLTKLCAVSLLLQ